MANSLSLNVKVQKVLGREKILTISKMPYPHHTALSEFMVEDRNMSNIEFERKNTHKETMKTQKALLNPLR